MKETYTPGDWVLVARPKQRPFIKAADGRLIYELAYGRGTVINPLSDEERMANARLIAAAPKVLTVLEFAATALELIDLTCNDSPSPNKRCEECSSCAGFFALQRARESIAEATGAQR